MDKFFEELENHIDRSIVEIVIIPFFGNDISFLSFDKAKNFIKNTDFARESSSKFRKIEIQIKYSNNDEIKASYSKDKLDEAINFLNTMEIFFKKNQTGSLDEYF